VTDPTAAMLRPLPEAPLQIALDDARRQIAEQKLTEPAGDNATESVLAAWHVDPDSGEVQRVIGELTDALAAVMLEFLDNGNEAGAREYFDHVVQLGQATATAGSPAQQRMREQLAAALEDSVERAARQFQSPRALEAVQLAREMQLDAAFVARLSARADAIPRRGQVLPNDPAGAVLGAGGVAISQRPVSVDEYTRFSKATGREPARCRDRVSPLRLFDPRSWREPGFPQGSSEPVVCVSLADAQAYARWYSQRTGHRYRLPSEAESRQTAPEISGREIALWLRDCGSTCSDHKVRGGSWRNPQSSRVLSAERGYDDVGFRLVREL
jgi:hypothetical protein